MSKVQTYVLRGCQKVKSLVLVKQLYDLLINVTRVVALIVEGGV